ncbi:hypothetical protein D3C80_2190640 [compost metagenome]
MLRRSVVIPSAPTSGNRLLASEAPPWIDTMAMINKQMGSSAEDALAGVDADILMSLLFAFHSLGKTVEIWMRAV